MALLKRFTLGALCLLLSAEVSGLLAQNAPLDNSEPVSPPASDYKLKKKKKRKKAEDAADEGSASDSAAAKKNVSGSLKVSHGAAFQADPIQVTRFNLSVNYALSPKHSFYVAPGARKYYEINGGDSEVDLADTPLGYDYALYQGDNFTHGVGLGATIATNQRSRESGMIAEPEVSYTLGASFFENVKLSMSLSPSAKYYVKEYKQTLDGTPLPRLEYGASASLGLSFYGAFSLALNGAYSLLTYEESKFTNDLATQGRELPEEIYVVGASATVPFADMWFLTAGYSHSASIDDYGSLSFILFEEDVTQWSVGLGVKF